MNQHKEKILQLRAEGKSYREIESILNCSRATIAYHCGSGQKQKNLNRQRHFRNSNPVRKKTDLFQNRKITKCFEGKIDCFQRERKNEKNRTCTFKWTDVIKKFGINPQCYLTGKDIDLNQPKTYSFDHIIPVSRGGNNSLDNLQITSKIANQAKSDLTNEEFIQLCKDVLIHHGYKISFS